MPHYRLAKWVRTIAVGVVVLAAALCIMQAYAMVHAPRPDRLDGALRAILYLAIGIGIGTMLIVLAKMVETRVDPTGVFLSALQQLQSQMDQLNLRVGTLAANLDDDRRDASVSPKLAPDAMMRIEEMLREIRELSLLGDSDRRDRLAHHLDQRKRLMSRTITELVNQHEFARAEQILIDLESQFPGDAHAVGCRRDLDAARRESEGKLVRQGSEQIEHLLAIGSWDQALSGVNRLVENFPQNPDARALLARVRTSMTSTSIPMRRRSTRSFAVTSSNTSGAPRSVPSRSCFQGIPCIRALSRCASSCARSRRTRISRSARRPKCRFRS